MRDAVHAPLPIQRHLPILIGGSGPKKTLRTTARFGDGWNTAGELDEVRTRLEILREHCADVGRDPSGIELTCSFPIVIRDAEGAAAAAYAERMAHNGIDAMDGPPVLLGEPERIADRLRPYVELGFRTTIVRLPAPYDHETLARIGEVAALLEA